MPDSLALKQQLRASIDEEIAARTKLHQANIARFKTAATTLRSLGAPARPEPLTMLANGDSWFDYPLSGNDLSLQTTDVIAQLTTMGSSNPAILNVSHYGEATTDELSLPKQQRMISGSAGSSELVGGGQAGCDPLFWGRQ